MVDRVALNVTEGIDTWQNPLVQSYTLEKVHMQSTNEVRRTVDNTEVVLRSILFYDCRLSKPHLNLWVLNNQSLKMGKQMTLSYNGQSYTVQTCDLVPDNEGKPHHYELGLV